MQSIQSHKTKLMRKLKRLFTPATLLLLIVSTYISCRKTDIQSGPGANNALSPIENRFITSHRGPDATEQTIVDFVQRQNSKKPFIEQTVKQIGYPRWDKAIKTKKAAKSISIRAASTTTNQPNTVTSQDGYDIYYVPFVRDSQNYVNASMVIKASPTDTSISYLCDWQYRNKPHGSPSVPSTAESYAMFFMMLDKHTLGHTEFNITDMSLFPAAKPLAGKKKLGFLNRANQTVSGKQNLMLYYHEECTDFYVCGSPDGYCAGGCDYLNCASEPGMPSHCYLVVSFCEG
jgi:hypothetical protein